MQKIGGYSEPRRKIRIMIGGDSRDDGGLDEEDEESERYPIDRKAEAAHLLFRTLGVPEHRHERASKALEAFINCLSGE